MVVSSEHGRLSKVTEAGEEGEKGKVEGDEVRGIGGDHEGSRGPLGLIQ